MRLPVPSLIAATAATAALVPALALAQADSAARAARVDRLFARWASTAAPGCAVAVHEAGRPRLVRAYGMADLEREVPNGAETIFEAGSVSKQFTAAAILLLAERGTLSLDDDVRKHVPELPDYTAQGGPVTIRHMLHHTSGLRDWGTVAEAEGWPRTTRAHTQAHVVDIASRQRSLNYRPGDEYLYSNTGYNLMAVIVERVSGVPFAEFTRRELFAPLGMTRTSWRDDHTRVVKGRAVAYARRAGSYHVLMPFENAHGNGGLLTTVGDLQRWNAALDGIAPADSTLPRSLVAALQVRGRLGDGREIDYARGIVIDRHRGLREVSHSGSTAGYRGWLARYPDQRLSVSLLCNTGEANPTRLGREVADAFLGDAVVAASPARAASSPARAAALPAGGAAALAARYAGLYRHPRTFEPQLVQARGDTLVASGVPLRAVSETEFASSDGGTRVTFELGTGGRVVAMRRTIDGETLRHEAVARATPDAAALAEYAGTYRSDEADATYAAVVRDGRLVLLGRPGHPMPLTPTYADAFDGDVGLVRFVRDASGRVTAMSFGMGRVRDLRFARVR